MVVFYGFLLECLLIKKSVSIYKANHPSIQIVHPSTSLSCIAMFEQEKAHEEHEDDNDVVSKKTRRRIFGNVPSKTKSQM
jgi:hypothetical protein